MAGGARASPSFAPCSPPTHTPPLSDPPPRAPTLSGHVPTPPRLVRVLLPCALVVLPPVSPHPRHRRYGPHARPPRLPPAPAPLVLPGAVPPLPVPPGRPPPARLNGLHTSQDTELTLDIQRGWTGGLTGDMAELNASSKKLSLTFPLPLHSQFPSSKNHHSPLHSSFQSGLD